jgi:acylglycerol lipase
MFMAIERETSATEERIQNGAGPALFVRVWRPLIEARGTVVVVPGFNSHIGYYTEVAERLVAGGLAVYVVDLRGRGQSEGERFYVERFDDYVSDVASTIDLARSRESTRPLFLLGHSAGGVVSCLYALEHQSALSGLICESFAFQLPAPDLALAVLKGLSHIAPHVHVLHLKNEDFSRDPKIVAAMNADPLIAGETQPTSTIAAMVRADERLAGEFSQITLPLLILHGTADKAAKAAGSQRFYDAAGASDKTLKLYDGHYHDLLNDLDRDVVLTDIASWIEARLS